LDENIGKVVAALEKKGLRENTLILFHSDNGGTRNKMFTGQMADVSKINLPCDNGPYRDGKGSLFEGGCRECDCANCPGPIKPQNEDRNTPVVHMYPTMAALARASTTRCIPLHGINVWDSIAEGKPTQRPEVNYKPETFPAGLRQGNWNLNSLTMLTPSAAL